MLKAPTVADLLLMPSLRTLSPRGIQSALEQFMRGYSFELFARMADLLTTQDPDYALILRDCGAEAISEVQEERGQHQGIYRFLYQDEVIGFVRMRLQADQRRPEPSASTKLVSIHVDAVLACMLAQRISHSLAVVEDRPARAINAPVDDFLAGDCEPDFTGSINSIPDASLRKLLDLDLLSWR
ncbi:hypothetical protein ACFOD4_20870 [Pseudoroseomonas globiformis]|uniref:Uncharacterized protein n=1 Tax=Teichococcus globiformis TaxID=2307229 RepID=A0ABV7G7K3_9PROT